MLKMKIPVADSKEFCRLSFYNALHQQLFRAPQCARRHQPVTPITPTAFEWGMP
jgi:hypothetical protein